MCYSVMTRYWTSDCKRSQNGRKAKLSYRMGILISPFISFPFYQMENFWKRLGASLRSVMENDSELKLALGEIEAGDPVRVGMAMVDGLAT